MMTKPSTRLFMLVCAGLAYGGCSSERAYLPCAPGHQLDEATEICVQLPLTCAADSPRSILASCTAAHQTCFNLDTGAQCGACLAGYRSSPTGCVPVVTCSELSCQSQGRGCTGASANADAHCGACSGNRTEVDGQCVNTHCGPAGSGGSILADCTASHRTCVDTGEGAACGDCFSYYVPGELGCRKVATCGDLQCASANRVCDDAGPLVDSSCGACLTGFALRDGVCVLQTGLVCTGSGADSILAACEAEHRLCAQVANGAQCGACKAGFVADVAHGTCIALQSCAALACGSQNRTCDQEPTGHCGACLDGYIEDDAGGCRAVVQCEDLACAEGDVCLAPTATRDAVCRLDCGSGALWNGVRCTPCPPCDAEGEVARWSSPTTAGYCICETEPGYYYSRSADIGTFRCDADDDGWVRESARNYITSNDPALYLNARCELRKIAGFNLVNEDDEVREVNLSQPLALYESVRNDDDIILDATWRARGLSGYGDRNQQGLRKISARELNRLTKFCDNPRADYNDNGAPDVAEWGSQDLAPTMLPEQRPFNTMSFFAELHRAWYAPAAQPGKPGRYVIQERDRPGFGMPIRTDLVSVGYASGVGQYWRDCRVDRDAAYLTSPQPVGMDFAGEITPGSGGFSGMSHHSQFKCLVVKDEPDPGVPTQIAPGTLVSEGYHINACNAAPTPEQNGVNPSHTQFVCSFASATSLSPGDAAWGAVPYLDYGPWVGGDYVRGCVNECVAGLESCPGYLVNPTAVNCVYDPANFGVQTLCEAWEVCDGFDNDGDGFNDNNIDPTKDTRLEQPCDTGNLGICAAGTTKCGTSGAELGTVYCQAHNAPLPNEICNGEDDNCNGDEDEGNPGGGVIACNTGSPGVCAAGTYSCHNGNLNELCVGKIAVGSQAEVCDMYDNDCDGDVDEPPNTTCSNAPGWRLYYLDADGDGYGKAGSVGQCLCRPDVVNKIAVTNNTDCCDTESGAKPGATAWHTGRTACNSYDWNCDGDQETHFNRNPGSGCGICAFCGCNSSADGWVNSVAGCGQTASYYGGCDWACGQNTYNRQQECR